MSPTMKTSAMSEKSEGPRDRSHKEHTSRDRENGRVSKKGHDLGGNPISSLLDFGEECARSSLPQGRFGEPSAKVDAHAERRQDDCHELKDLNRVCHGDVLLLGLRF